MELQSHYVCVLLCGYNILIVVGFLLSISSLFMRHRKAWLIVTLGIALYCVFVGASASVVRAGSMGILLVLGPAFGRRSMAVNAHALEVVGPHERRTCGGRG
jgi:predicted membrane metal-binding protein